MKKLVWSLALLVMIGLGLTVASDYDLPEEIELAVGELEEFFESDSTEDDLSESERASEEWPGQEFQPGNEYFDPEPLPVVE